MSPFPRRAPSYAAIKTDTNARELPRSRVEIAESALLPSLAGSLSASAGSTTRRCESRAFAMVR